MDEAKIIRDVVILKEDVATIKATTATQQAILSTHTMLLEKIATGVDRIQKDHTAAIEWLKRHDRNFEAHDKIIGHNCNFELAIS